MAQYENLKIYASKYGIDSLSVKTDKKLYSWIGSQRKFRKKGNVSEDHIKLLDDLDFNWHPR